MEHVTRQELTLLVQTSSQLTHAQRDIGRERLVAHSVVERCQNPVRDTSAVALIGKRIVRVIERDQQVRKTTLERVSQIRIASTVVTALGKEGTEYLSEARRSFRLRQ